MRPVVESAAGKPGCIGALSAKPVMWASPLMASPARPKPGQEDRGPVWP